MGLLAGCVDPVRSYLKERPHIPLRVQQAMIRRRVVPGMTKEAARLVWGAPEGIERTGKKTESWRYTRHIPGNVGAGYFRGYIVAFRGDVVSRVHELGKVDGKPW